MCYSVFLSTSSPEDLSTRSRDSLRFEKKYFEDPATSVLLHENQWYIGSSKGCSCAFRHAMDPELGFGEPVDWYQEDSADIQATGRFIEIVRELLSQGHRVDCVDAWTATMPADIRTKHVDLGALSNTQFRFFENHHFVFAKRERKKRPKRH